MAFLTNRWVLLLAQEAQSEDHGSISNMNHCRLHNSFMLEFPMVNARLGYKSYNKEKDKVQSNPISWGQELGAESVYYMCGFHHCLRLALVSLPRSPSFFVFPCGILK